MPYVEKISYMKELAIFSALSFIEREKMGIEKFYHVLFGPIQVQFKFYIFFTHWEDFFI
jgi:hypothetical protein